MTADAGSSGVSVRAGAGREVSAIKDVFSTSEMVDALSEGVSTGGVSICSRMLRATSRPLSESATLSIGKPFRA
ncbi:hypothetical protein D3C85_1861610 [compost metagenome]